MTDHTDLLARLDELHGPYTAPVRGAFGSVYSAAAAAIRELEAQLEALRILAREQVRGMTELQAQLEAANSTIATQRTEYEQINDAAITLQAQLEAARKVADGATEAQRTLFEQVETERKAQKEAERVIADAELTIGIHYRERVAAESRCATIEADTIATCLQITLQFEADAQDAGEKVAVTYLRAAMARIRALKSAAPQEASTDCVKDLSGESEPAPAADTAVSWGHPRQNYPGGPIYRVGISTGMVINPADTEGKT